MSDDNVQSSEELEKIQQESKKQERPEQAAVISISPKLRKKLHNLPDPKNPPLGYDEHKQFDRVFPWLNLPALHPRNHGDTVIFNSPNEPANKLYLGDNLEVLRTLKSESIDLIYIDPPFFSGRNYNVIWGDSNEVRTFEDIWEGGITSYLIWLNARLWEMRRVLKKTGSIYVHCDWHASHYIKTEMDKVFGYENLINELIWYYAGAATPKDRFSRRHDIILWYAKTSKWKFYPDRIRTEYAETTKERFKNYVGNVRNGGDFGPQELNPLGKHPDDVFEISIIPPSGNERIGYPTQKPVELLQKLIDSTTDNGDIVADFFCGGGTTLAVASGLRAKRKKTEIEYYHSSPRRFIGCDSSRVATSVTLDRLIKDGEEMSGVMSNITAKGKILQLGLQTEGVAEKVPNIEVNYVGVYPVDKFQNLDKEEFIKFVLTAYGASRNTGAGVTHGFRPPAQQEPIYVGHPDPNKSISAEEIKVFYDDFKSKVEPNKMIRAKIISWRFSRQALQYIKVLQKYSEKNNLPIELEAIPLDSKEFRKRILQRMPDVDEAELFLRFSKPPVIGDIKIKKIGELEYEFEAMDALSTNEDGWLVNCQWDFDYQEGHFAADNDQILCREKKRDPKRGEIFEAVLSTKFKFEKDREYVFACKVQDNLAGETVISKQFSVKE